MFFYKNFYIYNIFLGLFILYFYFEFDYYEVDLYKLKQLVYIIMIYYLNKKMNNINNFNKIYVM